MATLPGQQPSPEPDMPEQDLPGKEQPVTPPRPVTPADPDLPDNLPG